MKINQSEQKLIRQAVTLYFSSCKKAGLPRQILNPNLCEIGIKNIILRNNSGEVAKISYCKIFLSLVLAGNEYRSIIYAKQYLDCNNFKINIMEKSPFEKRILDQAIEFYKQVCIKCLVNPKTIDLDHSDVGLRNVFLNTSKSEVARIRYDRTHLYFELHGVVYDEPIKLK